ncbi:MAG: 4Fe-4S binding protein [Gemmatimonadetes bacterium]|nr:4Fe-4S binding protein [Gemmatimonadota bacterium]
MRCRQCGAPQQAYELVSAPVVEGELAAGSGEPKAMVRADVCVGCGTCVDACPEPGAITMHRSSRWWMTPSARATANAWRPARSAASW